MDTIGVSEALIDYGALGLIVLFLIVGGMREWYVWGPSWQRKCDEADRLRALLYRQVSITEKALDDDE